MVFPGATCGSNCLSNAPHSEFDGFTLILTYSPLLSVSCKLLIGSRSLIKSRLLFLLLFFFSLPDCSKSGSVNIFLICDITGTWRQPVSFSALLSVITVFPWHQPVPTVWSFPVTLSNTVFTALIITVVRGYKMVIFLFLLFHLSLTMILLYRVFVHWLCS